MPNTRYEYSHDLRLIALVMEHPEALYKWADSCLYQPNISTWVVTDIITRRTIPAFAEHLDRHSNDVGSMSEAIRDIYDRLNRNGQTEPTT